MVVHGHFLPLRLLGFIFGRDDGLLPDFPWHAHSTPAFHAFKSGHAIRTRSGSISNHFYGRAVDIHAVDGVAVSRANSGARRVLLLISALPAELRPSEMGHPFGDLRIAGGFSDTDHAGHLHVGFDD